jgi:WD40 repeat protein
MQIQPLHVFSGHNASIFALTAYAQPNTFLSAGGEGWIVGWNLEDLSAGQLLASIETNIFCLEYLPESGWAVAGGMDGGIYWIDLNKKSLVFKQLAHPKGCFGLAQAGNLVYSVGADGYLRVWRVNSVPECVETLHLNHEGLRSIRTYPAQNQLFIGGKCGTLFCLKLDTLELIFAQKNTHQNTIFSILAGENLPILYTGGRDALLKSWNLEIPNILSPISEQAAHHFTINALAAHPNLPLIATASRDKTIKIWDSNSLALLKVLDAPRYGGHIRSVNALYWSAYENLLVSASDDRQIRVWRVDSV